MHIRSESGSTKITLAVVALLFVAVLFGALGFFFRTTLQPYQPQNTARVTIEIERGQSPAAISRQLEAMQVIGSQKIFLYAGKLRGSWGKVKAGEYELSPSMTPSQIFDILGSGISVARPFLIREGQNIYEVADAIQAKGFADRARFLALTSDPTFIGTLGLDPSPKTLEGYLYPDTYFFARKTSLEEIVRTMVKRFGSAWGPNEELRAKELKLTRDQVITLASIVEKETGAPDERPVIAGVFHNRLGRKMRLQSDPTTIYGIWSRYKGNLHKADLLEATPYNTYSVPALPAGPISNPGTEAIHATLNPALHHFLYFVSRNDGTHVFTATYPEHEKAVAQFQLDRKAREGKSWRDLKGATPKVAAPKAENSPKR